MSEAEQKSQTIWGEPEHERQRMLDRVDMLEKALRKILFMRPPGPIPKLIGGSLIERIEIIARDAIESGMTAKRLMTLHDETMAMLTLDEKAIAAVEADMAKRHFVNRMADARAAIGVYLAASKQPA